MQRRTDRGTVPSGVQSEGVRDGSGSGEITTVNQSLTHSGTVPADLRGTLNAYGVYTLTPAKQIQMAEELAEIGVTPQQVKDLADYVAETEPDPLKFRLYLVGILKNKTNLLEALKNLEEHKRNRPAALSTGYFGETLFRNRESMACDDEEDRAALAYALVAADKKPMAYAAKVLDCDESEVERLVLAGSLLKSKMLPKRKPRSDSNEPRDIAIVREKGHRCWTALQLYRMNKSVAEIATLMSTTAEDALVLVMQGLKSRVAAG